MAWEHQKIKAGNNTINVKIAENVLRRAIGLSFKENGKMLFKFPFPVKTSIDMMFLSTPLYLYFFDSDKELIHKEKALPWSWNPKTWILYSPEEKYQYLLESFEELDLKKGDKLILG